MKHSVVIDSLFRYFNAYRGYTYQLCNAFVYSWESDFFCLASSGYALEIEAKVSKGDFRADFKKPKHQVLSCSNRYLVKKVHVNKIDDPKELERLEKYRRLYRPSSAVKFIDTERSAPNRFYYAVPEDLIAENEIPGYAGLIYTFEDQRRKPRIIKRAPSLHSRKNDFTKILLKKYYWAYLNSLGQKKHGKNFEFPHQKMRRTR